MTTRAWFVACLVCALACGGSGSNGSPDGGGTCVNVNNTTWTADLTTSSSTAQCNALTDTYDATVTQSGCTGTLTSGNKTLTGPIEGDTVSWSGSLAFHSGTLTITGASIAIAADLKSASGSFSWSFSGTSVSCTGTGTFTATIQ